MLLVLVALFLAINKTSKRTAVIADHVTAEPRSCARVRVAVLGSPSLIMTPCGMIKVFLIELN